MTRLQPPRTISVIAYLCFAIAGACFMFWTPSTGMKELLGNAGYYAWNWFLIAGGAFGALGSGRRNFRVEIIATPFLASGTGAYAMSLLPRVAESPSPGALAGLASIFMGIAFLMIGKGYVLWRRIKTADEIGRRTDGQ